MTGKLDFSDNVFGSLEPQTFHGPPGPESPSSEEVMSIPDAARLLNESRQTTWRRAKAGQLEEIPVGSRSFVRRADVAALLDAGKPGAQTAARPASLASSVAAGHARATSASVADQLSELVGAVAALQTELRSVHNAVRTLLLKGGGR